MVDLSLKEMLEAGVHFGHKTDRWNPKMRPFIFTARNGVHIFDLIQTKEKLKSAASFAARVASDGGTILFVGTKNQIRLAIKEAAEKAGMPYLVERWPGGMLTNFKTILERLRYLRESEEKLALNQGMTKKEQLVLGREIQKLKSLFEGVKDMQKLPDALFVADIYKEKIAVKEAKKLGIPVIGIADTNANPEIEYVIPGNDDAVRSVAYIVGKIVESIVESRKNIKEQILKEKGEEAIIDLEKAISEDEIEKLEQKAEETIYKKTK